MVEQEITDIMKKVFKLKELEFSRDLTARDIEKWDSLSHINFVLGVEKHFGVRFSNAEIASFENVGDMVDKIESTKAK